jgi:hypothetical protein
MATIRVSREQALVALQVLDAEHARADYFKKSEIVSCDVGYGVDVWVDREKWEDAKLAQGVDVSLIGVQVEGVPVCVLLI